MLLCPQMKTVMGKTSKEMAGDSNKPLRRIAGKEDDDDDPYLKPLSSESSSSVIIFYLIFFLT
jgi:hypothetical protein